jgi:hypothetical protein
MIVSAEAGDVDGEEVHAVCVLSGRSMANLQADVQRLRERREAASELARVATVVVEKAALEAEGRRAKAELDELVTEFNGRIAGLNARISGLNGRIGAMNDDVACTTAAARKVLRDTCDVALIERQADLSRELTRLTERERELREILAAVPMYRDELEAWGTARCKYCQVFRRGSVCKRPAWWQGREEPRVGETVLTADEREHCKAWIDAREAESRTEAEAIPAAMEQIRKQLAEVQAAIEEPERFKLS